MAVANDDQRMQMLKEFDDTMAGVKGVVDSGVVELPKIFRRPAEELAEEAKQEKSQAQVPVIDLSNINNAGGRKQIVEKVRDACETMGFFQVVNHTIPLSALDGIIDGIRSFHEQDVEEKKKYYSRDPAKLVKYSAASDLFISKSAGWRDTLTISSSLGSNVLKPEDVPIVCRDSFVEYSKHAEKLGNILFELLSEALGLEAGRLASMDCLKGHLCVGHYYPACPEPDLAMALLKHSDGGFLTIVYQNQLVAGLQVLYQDKWLDIHPRPGGLVVNVGDLLELVSNGRFKSNKHRVLANRKGPRVSVAWVFGGPKYDLSKVYGPIKELITKENPAIYREMLLADHAKVYFNSLLNDNSGIEYYKI